MMEGRGYLSLRNFIKGRIFWKSRKRGAVIEVGQQLSKLAEIEDGCITNKVCT